MRNHARTHAHIVVAGTFGAVALSLLPTQVAAAHAEATTTSCTTTQSHTEYRDRTRSVTKEDSTQETKWVKGWQAISSTTSTITFTSAEGKKVTLPYAWVHSDAKDATWYQVPAEILDDYWGSRGVQASYLTDPQGSNNTTAPTKPVSALPASYDPNRDGLLTGSGAVPLSSYGGPSSAGSVTYTAWATARTTSSYSAWGPWTAWSASMPTEWSTAKDGDIAFDTSADGGTLSHDGTIAAEAKTVTTTVTSTSCGRPTKPAGDKTPPPSSSTPPPSSSTAPGSACHTGTSGGTTGATTTKSVTLKLKPNGTAAAATIRVVQHLKGWKCGAAVKATVTVYGPATNRHTCTDATRIKTMTVPVVNGTVTSPGVPVRTAGHYTWTVAVPGTATTKAQRTACGAQSTLVRRPAYGIPSVPTGFDGMAFRRVLSGLAPARITLPGISAGIDRIGVADGAAQVPDDVARVGWLRDSASLDDRIGTTVIAGHVADEAGHPGAFSRLRQATVGQIVTVKDSKGHAHRFRIRSVASYARSGSLPAGVFSTTGAHKLVLITCTDKVTYPDGHYHYADNRVVTAVPVA